MFRNLKDKQITLVLLSLFIYSLILFFIVFIISSISLNETGKIFITSPSLFFLNWFPVCLLLALLYFITNNKIFSVSISSFVFIALSIANRLKILMRQSPLFPTDLTLVTEVAEILRGFSTSFIIALLSIVIAFIVLIAASFFIRKNKPLPLKIRYISILAILISSLALNFFFYSNERLFNSYPVSGNTNFKVNHYTSKGLIYSFLYNLNHLNIAEPENYNPLEFAEIEGNVTVQNNKKLPHVIMIMGEAFSGISENKNLDFSNYADPLYNWKNICAEDNTVSSSLIVSCFGGGTSDTEFDVLTGCSTYYTGSELPSYSAIKGPIPSLPRFLNSLGYSSKAMHPGLAWFYNRQNIYKYMGFESFTSISGFKDPEISGGYVSDSAAADMIISIFEEHTSENPNPLFSFSVTIQNHSPFEGKYAGVRKNFDTDMPLSDTEISMLSNYFKGISDADEALYRLVEYFRQESEPVVIVYFGDHLPGFSDGLKIFEGLDYDIDPNGNIEEQLNMYTVPYLIWENDAAANLIERKANLNLPDKISANYLPSILLDYIGIENTPEIFSSSKDLRDLIPVITPNAFLTKTLGYTDTLTEEDEVKLNRLNRLMFYTLYDKKVPNKNIP